MSGCLASTGATPWIPAVAGVLLLLAGAAFVVYTRRRRLKGGTALGLVLLLAVTGGLLATGVPAPAQASSCTAAAVSTATATPVDTTDAPAGTPTPTPSSTAPGTSGGAAPQFVGDSPVCAVMNTAAQARAASTDTSDGAGAAQYASYIAALKPLLPAELADSVTLIQSADPDLVALATAKKSLNAYLDATCAFHGALTDYEFFVPFVLNPASVTTFVNIDTLPDQANCVSTQGGYQNWMHPGTTYSISIQVETTGACWLDASVAYWTVQGTAFHGAVRALVRAHTLSNRQCLGFIIGGCYDRGAEGTFFLTAGSASNQALFGGTAPVCSVLNSADRAVVLADDAGYAAYLNALLAYVPADVQTAIGVLLDGSAMPEAQASANSTLVDHLNTTCPWVGPPQDYEDSAVFNLTPGATDRGIDIEPLPASNSCINGASNYQGMLRAGEDIIISLSVNSTGGCYYEPSRAFFSVDGPGLHGAVRATYVGGSNSQYQGLGFILGRCENWHSKDGNKCTLHPE